MGMWPVRFALPLFTWLSRDTYDIYFQNPALLPTIQAVPAEFEPSGVWTLKEGEHATIEHICSFIVEYINSDVMVRSLPCLCALSGAHAFVRITGNASESAYHHRRSVKGMSSSMYGMITFSAQ